MREKKRIIMKMILNRDEKEVKKTETDGAEKEKYK